jgi:hypothetical protein
MSDEMLAVSGTRRRIKELVDGTLRVEIDIEPKNKQHFLELFPQIDAPVALAPLGVHVDTEKTRVWAELGPLARSAVQICKEENFQFFVLERIGGKRERKYLSELAAADYIKQRCKVESRKDLDTADGAKERFGALMAEYREWLRRNA